MLLILKATYAVKADTLTVVVVVASLALAVAHFLADRANPNKDAEANRRTAAERVASGALRHQPGRPGPVRAEHADPIKSVLHTAAVALLFVAVAATAAPEVVRAVRGWPANDDTYPPVAGPGDVARVYMGDKIQSIKGYWRGRPHVAVKTPDGRRLDAQAKTNDNNWGSSISAKSSEKSSSSTPWVEVTLPAADDLAGKTVECAIDLNVTYPHMAGSNNFDEEERTMSRTVPIRLASAGAGGEYDSLWWGGTLGGMALLLMCGQVLRGSARNLQRSAPPAKLYAGA